MRVRRAWCRRKLQFHDGARVSQAVAEYRITCIKFE